jgi:beta-barrel assembly-enhancing protease
MNEIKITLYGPGLPPSGQAMHCVVGINEVHISTLMAAHMHTIKLVDLQASVVGFDHDQLQLSWQHQSEDYSFITIDKAEQKKLISILPKNDIPGLVHWKRSTLSQSWVWKGLLYTFGVIAIAAVTLVWQYDRVTTWAANRVSMKTEKNIGESVLKSLNASQNLLSQGEAVNVIRDIGQKITTGSRYQYQWFVSKDPEVNAYAIPGGIIVVNRGLLNLVDSPNELAAVLAHEVQHVEERHALKNMLNSAAMATVLLAVLGDTNAVVLLMAHQVSTQYFSRQVESDADLKGMQLLQSKNIDVGGMSSFFKKMDAYAKKKQAGDNEGESDNPSQMASWFSSHPDTLSRIQFIEQYITSHPCNTCTALTWDHAALKAELSNLEKK